MSVLKIVEPTRLLIPEVTDQIKSLLTYDDQSVRYQIHRLKANARYGKSDWAQERIESLQAQVKKTLLFKDKEDNYYTYSGLASYLQSVLKCEIEDLVEVPEPGVVPFKNPIEFELRDYQKEAVEKLIRARHAAAELPTGAGKSQIILHLCFELGLKAVIVAPLKSIAEQLYNEFVFRFGQQYVGMYGGGKKKADKLFTIAVAQSMVNIEKGSELYSQLQSDTKVLIFDESHVTPAETFEKLCMGIFRYCPYRFFLSATQTRIDGGELLLKGIIGPIVCSRTYQDLVKDGHLSQGVFKVFNVAGPMQNSSDPKREVQNQLFNNPAVNRLAADIATKAVNIANRPTLILIEEFKQFSILKNYIDIPFEFVHGGIPADAKNVIPQEYWKCDKQAAIDRFNKGETKLLIGTSAISTGVDLKPTQCIIYLQGGKSEIKVRQSIGRGTRVVPGKKDFWVVDFSVSTSRMMQKHLTERAKIYSEMGTVEYYGF